MNCCDSYGNCRQGRDCPIRKPAPCKWCKDTGIDETGGPCVCSPHHHGDILAWALAAFIALMVVLMAIRSCST